MIVLALKCEITIIIIRQKLIQLKNNENKIEYLEGTTNELKK